jgi:hypothetical protein
VDIDLDTGRLWVFIGGLLLFLGFESLWPARAWVMPRARRWLFHGGIAALNTVLV